MNYAQHCEKVITIPGSIGLGTEDRFEFCYETAEFLYSGLIPEIVFPDATKAEIKRLYARGNPCQLMLCPDHAKQMAHDFDDLIISRKVRIERLRVNKLRFRCRNCLISVTMIWDNTELSTNPGSLDRCPRCGEQSAAAWPDIDEDYVDWVCEQFEGMPRQLVIMLHQEWPRNDRRYPTFRRYVEAQIEQFDSEGTFEAVEEA